MRARVVRDYRTQYANPIRFAAGEIVTLGERDTEWPAFIWTITADGNAGWAPLDWLKPLGDSRAEALRDYSAQELDADAGDTVELLFELGGWWWASHDNGSFGWLPASNLSGGFMIHPTTATALFVLNDLRHAAMDALKNKHKTPALVLFYSFIDICAALSNDDSKKSNQDIFKDYLTGFYEREWRSFTPYDLWAARSSILHAYSPLGRHTQKVDGAVPIYYYEYPETREEAEKEINTSVHTRFHLLRITDIKTIAIQAFNEMWRRVEESPDFEAVFRKNASHLLKDLTHLKLEKFFSDIHAISELKASLHGGTGDSEN